MSKGTILVTGGTGQVGQILVKQLARSPLIKKIVVASIEDEIGKKFVKMVSIGAAMHAYHPKIEFLYLDLFDEEKTATTIKELEPQVILHTATLLSSYYYTSKIKKLAKNFGFKTYFAGHTLAKDLFLIYKLMKAHKRSGMDSLVVNNAFPDISNNVLSKIGLAPTIGSGTIGLTVHGIKKILADKYQKPMNEFLVEMVAHHSLRVNPPEDVPYYLKIRHNDEDITDRFNLDKLVGDACKLTIGDPKVNNSYITASSAAQNVLALIDPPDKLEHAPGANGLLGGSPVRFQPGKVEVVPPKGLTLQDIEEINKKGLQYDGIEKIKEDGTVIFTKKTSTILQEILKINMESMRISEIEKMAFDLVSAYKKL